LAFHRFANCEWLLQFRRNYDCAVTEICLVKDATTSRQNAGIALLLSHPDVNLHVIRITTQRDGSFSFLAPQKLRLRLHIGEDS